MNRKEILKELYKTTRHNIKFPKENDPVHRMEFDIIDGTLYVKVKASGVVKNMQEDDSSFEGWTICIKSYIDQVKNVELDWEQADSQCTANEHLHYNRFLMRVVFFIDNYGSWFHISDNRKAEIVEFRKSLVNLAMNFPSTECKGNDNVTDLIDIRKKEYNIECNIVKKMRSNGEYEIANHQLPVGLFGGGVVSRDMKFTPIGASQIDLWSLSGNTLGVYELKIDRNLKVGIISELMYYANLMNLFVTSENVISYPQEFYNQKRYYRDVKRLSDAVKSCTIRRIKAVFLCNKYHALIDGNKVNILNIINRQDGNSIIEYDFEPVSKYIVD